MPGDRPSNSGTNPKDWTDQGRFPSRHPAANPLGRALHSSLYERTTAGVPNFARYTFLDDDSHRSAPRDAAADISVAILVPRLDVRPHDRQLQDLVGELSTLRVEFRRRWSAHEVRLHGAGSKSFHHPVVGELAAALAKALERGSEPGERTATGTATRPETRR